MTVRLRCVERSDLPKLFEFQLDLEANRMAFTHPRRAEEFDTHWDNILADSSVVARAILADDVFAGCISCFQCDGLDSIGYWIGKDFWNKGVATQALQQFLAEVPVRPLHSRVAATNVGSLRVLQKCGFRFVRHEWSPATDRYIACDEAVLQLASARQE